MKKGKFYISLITELLGIIITSMGIAYESIYKADVGFVIISTGSLLISVGGILYAKFKPWLDK